jgi:pimeloyl-ACP methyl ester carboxylesterase/tetratricopeptide (TPR) repeat protein
MSMKTLLKARWSPHAIAAAALVLLALAGVVPQARLEAEEPLAPELTGLGSLQYKVTTANPKAQRFFDQGLRLLYAFNHAEALRAFREAARLDPALAMAHWGQAMALGPNLNAAMSVENARHAHEAIQRAKVRGGTASARERELIEALAARYAADPGADRAPLDRAYAAAMRRVATRHPDDPDIQTLFGDAAMNTMPWDYWEKDGSPKPDTVTVIATLEAVIAKHPEHAGAHHYFIHVMEASNDPDRAVPSADRLGSLMPAAGHIVHMPAHIFIRVGRYGDAAEANVRAIAADEDYLAQCQRQALYPVTYYPHNLHFLWAAATLEGRSAVAVDAARTTAAKVPHHHAGALPWTADFPVTPMLAYVRFGMWKDVLTEPSPPPQDPYANGIWHYARALAFIAHGRSERAATESKLLTAVMAHEAFTTTLKDSPLLTNLKIAARIVDGELATRARRFEDAVRVLEEAVALEDGIPYNEPPVWHQPPRQVLGAVLLEAGRAGDAELVYLEDLGRFRENGWSLFGLMQSLEAQGRVAEAADARRRFEKAWARADITLTSSRILGNAATPARKSIALSNGITLEYVEQGDPAGVPVVLLHGVTDSWRSFEPMLPYLPRSLHAFAITQRGHGESSRPQGAYRFEDFAGDVRLFIDAVGLERAVIVGHSMGSGVAQRFAADYPERTLGVVLAGSFATLHTNLAVRELWDDAVSMLADPVDPGFVLAFQQSTIARPIDSSQLDVFVKESLKVPAHVWRATFAHFIETDVSGVARRVAAPTLVVWGERDAIVGRQDQETLAAAIHGSRLLVYADVGHTPQWETPARFASDLLAFILTLGRGHAA